MVTVLIRQRQVVKSKVEACLQSSSNLLIFLNRQPKLSTIVAPFMNLYNHIQIKSENGNPSQHVTPILERMSSLSSSSLQSRLRSNLNRHSHSNLVQTRNYSRDPLQAEHEANTVRGHRSERARNEQLKAKALEEESKRASITNPASNSSSQQSGSHGGNGGQNGNGKDRNIFDWRTTPTKWYPIPVLLGAFVLIGIQARRNYVQDKKALENGGRTRGGKIVDENGHVVTMQGPWTVSNSIIDLGKRKRETRLMEKEKQDLRCNLDEMKDPDLTKYKSLGEFFYRELKDGVRPIASTTLVSPADGKVLHFGSIEGRRVEQVKGITYSLDALLGTSSPAESTESLDLPSTSGSSKKSPDEVLDEERVVHWSWWKSWIVKPTKGSNTTGIPPSANPSSGKGGDKTPPSHDDDEEVEAGMPTPDTPEVLGRYANVAYEMGSGALPPILQPHSPGHEGLAEGNKLFFCVVYLAPGDYHRFHSPASWIVERRRHFRGESRISPSLQHSKRGKLTHTHFFLVLFTGELYSVSPYMASRLGNLFVLNERVALLGRWRYGFFGMIPVGATNVGSIRINFDRALRTNVRDQRALAGTYSEASYGSASRLLGGQPLLVGTEMGGFLLGSTIVLVFEAPENFKFEVEAGSKIKVERNWVT
ncbi:hypothetical protein L7F22_027116 [Adiantum nelumboides]|nr:hypothetical protein [Adiantum nelumboides]